MVRLAGAGLLALDPATTVGMVVGLTAGAAIVEYGIGRGDLLLMGAVTGLGVGALQALVLARERIPGAYLWATAIPPAWALGWFVSSYVDFNKHRRAVRDLRCERSDPLRTSDLVASRVSVPSDGTPRSGGWLAERPEHDGSSRDAIVPRARSQVAAAPQPGPGDLPPGAGLWSHHADGPGRWAPQRGLAAASTTLHRVDHAAGHFHVSSAVRP